MRRESHVRFREGVGVKFPRATRPVDPRLKFLFFQFFTYSQGRPHGSFI